MRMLFAFGFLMAILSGCGTFSLTPRSNSIFGLQFSDQPPRTLIDMTCNGVRRITEGVAVCEEKSPKNPQISIKIMPIPGRVVYSDGLRKKTEDFNWRKGGWFWKSAIIDTTWVPLDLGELTSIYGDVPLAVSVEGMNDNGIIVNSGVIYTRICNDKDIPCSQLIVNYDCDGKILNTYVGQLGSCARMSGSSQKFSIPIKTPEYTLKAGAKVGVQAGRTGWQFKHEITAQDVEAGEVKFLAPDIQTGPDLFTLNVGQWEQGVLQKYRTNVLIVGSSPKWTGIDRPHYYPTKSGADFCMPTTADLLEVSGDGMLGVVTKECQAWPHPKSQVCAFAYDRESGDQTYACVKNGKEVRFP
jgi:hypothetical protein